jgi:hypothetical protein
MQDAQDIPRWLQVLGFFGVPASIFVGARWSTRAYVREVVREETAEMKAELKQVSEDTAFIRGWIDGQRGPRS